MSRRSGQLQRPVARAVDVVIVGAGHSGLAMSRCLAERSVEHVILERGEVANSWRHERWDSLRLLTPNWQSSLPGYAYSGAAPDDFMTMPEVVDFIDGYAASFSAPVMTQTEVETVRPDDRGYRVVTNRGIWSCRCLVVATGAFETPNIPAVDSALPASIRRIASKHYRNPEQIGDGAVLVVGASATGLQLASELSAAGRRVLLAVGEHVRMPRRYRGRDIQWWMHSAGLLDQSYTDVDDIDRARRVPSPQLVGSAEHATLDLNALEATGVEIVGRLVGVSGTRAQFSGTLRNCCMLADLKLDRLLGTFDAWAADAGIAGAGEAGWRPEPTRVPDRPRLAIDLVSERVGTVVWATGLRPNHAWLDVPAFDRRGRILHDGGVVRAPGMYVLGLPFLRRRKSSYIHGAEADARDLAAHLDGFLRRGDSLTRAVGACA